MAEERATGSALEVAARRAFGARVDLAGRYAELLTTTGIEWGLVGPGEAGRMWERHLLNCAVLAAPGLIPDGVDVIDVGSGAGLPGIPLAIARPDVRVTLLEPKLRRAQFLEVAVDRLGLGSQVTVVRGRAEDGTIARTFPVVTCRAVAPLDRLVGWCEPLVAPDGQLLALKGEGASEEVAAARPVLESRGLRAEVLTLDAGPAGETATVVRVTSNLR